MGGWWMTPVSGGGLSVEKKRQRESFGGGDSVIEAWLPRACF